MSLVAGPGRQQPIEPSPNISRPIRYYTKDSLTLDDCEKGHLYGEIYGDSTPQLPARPEVRQRHAGLLLLLVAAAVLSTISIALYAVIIPLWERNFEHIRFPLKGDWTDGFILLPLSISLLACIYLIFAILRSRKQTNAEYYASATSPRSTSPSAGPKPDRIRSRNPPQKRGPDTFYLILLSVTVIITLVPLLVLATSNSLARAFRAGPSPSRTQAGMVVCTSSNMLTRPCAPVLYQIGELQLGAGITAALCLSLWVGILISAIRSHRKAKKEAERRKQERLKRREERRRLRRERRELEREELAMREVQDKIPQQPERQERYPKKTTPTLSSTASELDNAQSSNTFVVSQYSKEFTNLSPSNTSQRLDNKAINASSGSRLGNRHNYTRSHSRNASDSSTSSLPAQPPAVLSSSYRGYTYRTSEQIVGYARPSHQRKASGRSSSAGSENKPEVTIQAWMAQRSHAQ